MGSSFQEAVLHLLKRDNFQITQLQDLGLLTWLLTLIIKGIISHSGVFAMALSY
jgi:hypothetical protein